MSKQNHQGGDGRRIELQPARHDRVADDKGFTQKVASMCLRAASLASPEWNAVANCL